MGLRYSAGMIRMPSTRSRRTRGPASALGTGLIALVLAVDPACARPAPDEPASAASASTTAPAPAAPARSGLQATPDGTGIVDLRTGQVWARCVEGMHWSGRTCVGTPRLVTHREALALAAARRKAEGLRWRLPRVPDMQRLSAKAGRKGVLDLALFPAAPDGPHWTGTANVDTRTVNPYRYDSVMQGRTRAETEMPDALSGWAADPASGQASGEVSKREKLPVRLVRPGP